MPDATPLTRIPGSFDHPAPTDAMCQVWWGEYAMLDNIKRHSALVADVATDMAELAVQRPDTGLPDKANFVQSVRAAALLHDLGKSYCIAHGGNHSQIGAAWVMGLTGDPHLAQGVMHHFFWPGDLDLERHFLPLTVMYADKRVTHDQLVSITDRYDDLMVRYGTNETSRDWITRSRTQLVELEHLFTDFLGADIHEYPFDRRRLVR